MTIIDYILIAPIVYGLVRGLMRGFVGELTNIVALVAGVLCAKFYAGEVAQYLSEVVTWEPRIINLIAYATVFIVVTLILHLIGRLIARFLSAIALGGINKLLGAVFGAAKWVLIISVILTGVNMLDEQFHFIQPEIKEKSVLYEPMLQIADAAWAEVKNEE